MVEPTTPNTGLIVPNTGDLPGAWGTAALNVNWTVVDGYQGGVLNFAISGSTTVALGNSGAILAPTAGPNQQANALIVFSGALTGATSLVQFNVPGYYIVQNSCTNTQNFGIALVGAGSGNAIGCIPGKKQHIFYDGNKIDYVNMPDPGSAFDLHGATGLPPHYSALTNTVLPYLIKDGSTQLVSTYPALAAVLGSTFGGDGVTTFGLPDERARMRIGYDTGGTGRVTTAGSGINGATMGSAGGDQLLQSHTHANTLTDNHHTHSYPSNPNTVNSITNAVAPGNTTLGNSGSQVSSTPSTAPMSINNATTGSGGSQNMPPSIVSFLALIKT